MKSCKCVSISGDYSAVACEIHGGQSSVILPIPCVEAVLASRNQQSPEKGTQTCIENRESFFSRLRPFHSPGTLLDIELAYTLAKFSHRAQTRKELDSSGNPLRYFEHVRRVALILIDEAHIVHPDLVIASLLHDGVEDTRDVTPEMIEHCFGRDVSQIVKVLSKTPKEGYVERFRIANDWRAYTIKMCDRLDNLRSLHQTAPEFQAKQIKETREKYIPLFNGLSPDIIPGCYFHGVMSVRDKIISFVDSFAPIA